jgi:hypothetical protein
MDGRDENRTRKKVEFYLKRWKQFFAICLEINKDRGIKIKESS